MKDSALPIKTIQELKAEAEKICGAPAKPKFTDEVVAVVKWVDGTVLDSVWRIDE
jgi:citrate lyase subunit alpha/citrate CoA-transferase